MTADAVTAEDLCARAMVATTTADAATIAELFHPAATNRESAGEPPACRGPGPAAALATARWLAAAFSELHCQIHDSVQEDDLVVLHLTLSGRQTGPFVPYGPDGRPAAVFPATGRRFAVTQTHWMRVADGQVIEHWANRDDRGLGQQLGWSPPSPRYLLRMLVATRRARAGIVPDAAVPDAAVPDAVVPVARAGVGTPGRPRGHGHAGVRGSRRVAAPAAGASRTGCPR